MTGQEAADRHWELRAALEEAKRLAGELAAADLSGPETLRYAAAVLSASMALDKLDRIEELGFPSERGSE